jgi:hypothetical protein
MSQGVVDIFGVIITDSIDLIETGREKLLPRLGRQDETLFPYTTSYCMISDSLELVCHQLL